MSVALCIDARLLCAYGIGTFLHAILEEIEERASFPYRLLYAKKEAPLIERFPCEKAELKSRIYSIKEQLEMPYKIGSCTLFWSPHFNIPLLPIKAKKRIVTLHDVHHLAKAKCFTWQKRAYAQLLYNAALSLSDQVTTVSNFSYNEIIRFCAIAPKRIAIFPPGVHARFRAKPLSREMRLHYQIPERYILAVGNGKPHKNLQTLFTAYLKLSPPEHLLIVGHQAASFHEKIHFLGYVDNDLLPSLYTHASCLVFPSLYEGFGMPPLEAMACGSPVLASNCASIPEVCGDAAHYFEPLDADELAEKLLQLLQNETKRGELIAKGLVRARQFSAKT
jgi:glycosyltransferase involved in cell wall biosynthesis